MPATPTLLRTSEAGVLTLTLNRPDKLNAIDNPMAEALLDALNAAANDPAVQGWTVGAGFEWTMDADVVFDAAQALAWGLVYRCVAPDELDAVSLAAARRVADLKPEVAREFKRVLNQIGLERFERAVEEESAVQRRLGQGDAGA